MAEWPTTATKRPKVESKVTPVYGWQQVHEDMEKGKYVGVYGGSHSAYHGLASVKVDVDLKQYHQKRSPDEFYVDELDKHLQRPSTRRRWGDIVTMDPLGMYGHPPTCSATTAKMDIPELKEKMTRDGRIVTDDGCINCVKCAVDYVWNLPALAERLGLDEKKMRQGLADYTQNDRLLNMDFKAYLPPVGGVTVYFIGDISKLHIKQTEVAVRVHDACCGSDVFGTDICTCRPYLVYAIEQAVMCAQRGGVGIIIYYQKEGRSLGEVTKFRVYNARKRQPGGDRPEMYFYQTETIAGIRDARFQEMMPDVLLWLGIERIDWLLSMSSDKYDAITSAGIDVMQRVALPDMYVPKGAEVEITAKIASGYHAENFKSHETLSDLRRLETVRERCTQIFDLAVEGKSTHFSVDLSKVSAVVDKVIEVTKQNYPDFNIPYHSRWRHFDQKEIDALVSGWHCDKIEKARRLLDLATVSVLLDAGAGDTWHYVDNNGNSYSRSEGLAKATLEMFKEGAFSSDVAQPHRVNAHGLRALTLKQMQAGFQVNNTNQMTGFDGRHAMIQRLGQALLDHPEYFGHELARPGNLVDYVLKEAKDNHVSISALWQAVILGFEKIWPENHAGVRRGDVWIYSALRKPGQPGSDHVPFHKLSQWLTYSLLEPIESLGVVFDDMGLLTGLAEYRNGGLFIDLGVLTPKDPHAVGLVFDVGSELVVEWRALTVILLDKLAEGVRAKLGKTAQELPLAKILQGGSWAAGRVVAREKRPATCAPPIVIRSDGTVF